MRKHIIVGSYLFIQADFATSAVDFLHRIGRTARAGQYGLVTSFYTHSNRDLVAAVRQAGERGHSVVIDKLLLLLFFMYPIPIKSKYHMH